MAWLGEEGPNDDEMAFRFVLVFLFVISITFIFRPCSYAARSVLLPGRHV